MRITHIFLAGPYNDDWSYHENCLPYYQKKLMHEVVLITTSQAFHGNPPIIYSLGEQSYIDKNGILVHRLEAFLDTKSNLFRKLGVYPKLIKTLESTKPDLIFVHCFQVLDILRIARFVKRNTHTVLLVDNHADQFNSANSFFSKYIVHKILWRLCANIVEQNVKRFLGVSPIRVQFLKDYYKLKDEKIELTLMGSEDEKNLAANSPLIIKGIRKKYNISDTDFLIVSGGKIDAQKHQIITLMQVIKEIKVPNVKLIIFGSVSNELKDRFYSYVDNDTIHYIGWITADETYKYIQATDLCVFPGSHSVLWEQCVGSGKPAIFKYWPGMTHLDVGGNCKFLINDTKKELKEALLEIINDPKLYQTMLNISQNQGVKAFAYSEIAKQSLSYLY